MITSMQLADYVIYISNKKKKPISNLQLQKVLYYLNVIYLLKKDHPIFKDYKFQRWDYGPVLPNVYAEYSNNGSSKILKPETHITIKNLKDGDIDIITSEFNEDVISDEIKTHVKDNIDFFINMDPFKLVEKSHEEDQWKEMSINQYYNDRSTIEYYEKNKNQFWNK